MRRRAHRCRLGVAGGLFACMVSVLPTQATASPERYRILVLDTSGDAPAAERKAHTQEIVDALKRDGHDVQTWRAPCDTSDDACLVQQLKRSRVDLYVLASVWRKRPGRNEATYYLSMRDAEHQAPFGSVFVERECKDCSTIVRDLITEAFRQWPNRGGTLVNLHGPPGAVAFQRGGILGKLPLRARFPAGPHRLRIHHEGISTEISFNTADAESQTVDVTTQLGGVSVAKSAASMRAPRDVSKKRKIRLGTGGAMLGAGAVLMAVAVVGYAKTDTCREVFGGCASRSELKKGNHALMATGAALFAGGLGVGISGLVLRSERDKPDGVAVAVSGRF